MSPDQRKMELAVGLAAVTVFLALGLAAPLHHDTLVDLLLARDCQESVRCVGHRSSFRHLLQGATWTRAIASVWSPSRGFGALEVVVAALQALAAAWVARIVYVMIPTPVGWPRSAAAAGAGGLTVLWTLVTTGHPVVWNPSLCPTAVACTYLGIAGMDRSDHEGVRLAHCLLAAIGAALAIQTHIVTLPLLAGVVFAAAGRGRTFWPIIAVAPAVVLSAAASEADFVENVRTLQSDALHLSPLAVGGLAASAAFGFALRGAGWLVPRGRTLALTAALVSICALGALAVGAVAGREVSARYLLSVLPVMAALPVVAVAWMWPRLATRTARRSAVAILALASLGLAWSVLVPRVRWRFFPEEDLVHPALAMEEARKVSRRLELDGFQPGDLLWRLQGARRGELTIAAAAWSRQAGYSAHIPDSVHSAPRVIVLRAPPRPLWPDWEVVALRGRRVALVSSQPSRLAMHEIEWCFEGDEALDCVRVSPEDWRTVAGGSRSEFARLSDLRLESVRDFAGERPVVEVRIPIRHGSPRRVDLMEGAYRGWSIAPPAGGSVRSLELEPSAQRLVLRHRIDREWPVGQVPAVLETNADEAELRRMLDLVQGVEADNLGPQPD